MDDELEFSDIIIMLRRHLVLFLTIFVIVFGLSLAYTLTSQRIYESRTLILVSEKDQVSALLGQSGQKVDLETQKEIVMSESVLTAVYEEYSKQEFAIIVQPVKNSNVLEIRINAADPDSAMIIANIVAASYINYSRKSKVEDALSVNDFISEQLVLYQLELDNLNMKLITFNQTNATEMTPAKRVEYQNLVREMAAKNKLYDYLLSRKEETNIAAKERGSNVKIIEYASLPIQPVRPNIPLYLALGFILALVLSFSSVYVASSLSKEKLRVNDGPVGRRK